VNENFIGKLESFDFSRGIQRVGGREY